MKYVDGIRRRITIRIAAYRRRSFSNFIKQLPDWKKLLNLNTEEKSDFDFISFSCSRDVEEQVLSILSLLKWYGYPKNWYIYSDGSHTETDIKILQSLGSFVKVVPWNKSIIDNINHPHKDDLYVYCDKTNLGKKLVSFMGHKIATKTVFLDSDILFYKDIKHRLDIIKYSSYNWYLPDCGWGTLDTRYRSQVPEGMFQINGGCVLLNKDFNWDAAIEFVHSLKHDFQYFTDQTAMHIAVIDQNSYPLDPRKFILHNNDQFIFSTSVKRQTIALRHYTSPVRHKIWQYGYKWHLTT